MTFQRWESIAGSPTQFGMSPNDIANFEFASIKSLIFNDDQVSCLLARFTTKLLADWPARGASNP